MTIREICDLLKKELLNNGYEYGFYLDGKKYKPDMSKGFDEEFDRALHESSRIQAPEDTARGKFHTILTFEAENKVVYLELTPQSRKPWYGKEIIYDNEKSFILEYTKGGCDITDITGLVIAGASPELILSRFR